jgi:hypothetical protein
VPGLVKMTQQAPRGVIESAAFARVPAPKPAHAISPSPKAVRMMQATMTAATTSSSSRAFFDGHARLRRAAGRVGASRWRSYRRA